MSLLKKILNGLNHSGDKVLNLIIFKKVFIDIFYYQNSKLLILYIKYYRVDLLEW